MKEVVDMFEGLLEKLLESHRRMVMRSLGLKIEQLKVELEQLNEFDSYGFSSIGLLMCYVLLRMNLL
ncbi:hypothetical protein CK203_039114 [Vitis vinifera]|uniref:Uncharacterized protein n=1 Tax=Vitis vinifera TaxID=29760 RepID=A0A438IFP8_VITVI|nr:hypothetical protein CK203_039114 [Vitis vinifera]